MASDTEWQEYVRLPKNTKVLAQEEARGCGLTRTALPGLRPDVTFSPRFERLRLEAYPKP